MENTNNATEFILHGQTQERTVANLCFLVFLVFYAAIIWGNPRIIITLRTSEQLNSPIDLFLSCLSFIDISYSAVSAPKLIHDLRMGKKTISFVGCIAQLFESHFFRCTEIFLLIMMMSDSCIAICKSLHDRSIMSRRVRGCLVIALWLWGLVHSTVQTLLVLQLPFCGPSGIDHCFYEVHSLLELA
ncbi:PREDICTED: olfactory receptor 4S2-like, partial [Acanthisitta chloris]|uniref:olfactory receptor 4S2-like n=1 Tax=Acanthisitta chloris TaxID=57068 RepID=UPI0004F0FFEC